ncbi:TraR/DksA C4-type zinc finger protein [Gluconobacter potus]|uniref:TraR/DksA C4-type zinc finger protein n=1 Tax=Gluconobacter potus TaxID=2724927 RepID=UPI0009BF018E|nr:TraR/DksA C4-type zinc finger protein [Gluconobacter potus]
MDDIDRLQDTLSEDSDRLQRERARRHALEANAVIPEHRECHECGESIPGARLRARPLATLCIDCQQDAERHHS